MDLNQRPLGYEPNELPDCSTPHNHSNNAEGVGQTAHVHNRMAAKVTSRFRPVTVSEPKVIYRRTQPSVIRRNGFNDRPGAAGPEFLLVRGEPGSRRELQQRESSHRDRQRMWQAAAISNSHRR